MEIVSRNGIKIVESELLKGVKHGFTLREGGVSGGGYASLNLGLRRGDDAFNVFENIKMCADTLELERRCLTLTNQTHTGNVIFLTRDDVGKGLIREWGGGVDGIVTDMEKVPLMCYSADCVPLLLFEKNKRIVGAVHSGWRGTSENIAENAIDVIEDNGGRAEDICAFIGPAIDVCCYEISCDVAEHFLNEFPDCVKDMKNGKYMLDLKGIVRAQLIRRGVLGEKIEVCSYCTSCNNDMFFSHRRQNGKSGLLGGFIQLG